MATAAQPNKPKDRGVLRSREAASISSSNASANLTTQHSYVTIDEYFRQRGYTFGRVIGTGSYAKVRVAEYTSPTNKAMERKQLAVKIVNRRKAPDDFIRKFLPRELSMLGRISHENIIKTYEIYDSGHQVFVFMEYAEHGDLLELIRRKNGLSNDLAKRFFNDTCQAIKYLHNLHIAHRDLKCENLLITRKNSIKLADFGFARSCMVDNRRVLSCTFCGSAAYASPEILQGVPYNPKYYDIWSLGCVLYVMLAGYMPFDDADVNKMVKVQLARALRYPSKMDPLAKDLIHSMLDPEVVNRPSIGKVLKFSWLLASSASCAAETPI